MKFFDFEKKFNKKSPIKIDELELLRGIYLKNNILKLELSHSDVIIKAGGESFILLNSLLSRSINPSLHLFLDYYKKSNSNSFFLVRIKSITNDSKLEFIEVPKDKSIVVGRSAINFNSLDHTLSRKHFEIKISKDEIIVNDLNSLNGTTVVINPNKLVPYLFLNYLKNKFISDCLRYLGKIPTVNELFNERFEDFVNLIYAGFCTYDFSQEFSSFYNEKNYDENIAYLRNTYEKNSSTRLEESKNWLFLKIKEGIKYGDSNDPIGKIFINIDSKLITDLLEILVRENLPITLKLPKRYLMLNRSDKFVVYFNNSLTEELAEKLLPKLNLLLKNSKFQGIPPLFSTIVFSKEGELLRGVGFGEEDHRDSFNGIRAKLLADMTRKVFNQHTSFVRTETVDSLIAKIREDNIKTLFDEICSDYGIDNRNPAFKSHGKDKEDMFLEIKKKTL